MTFLDIAFRYGARPGENELRALDRVRQVYGIRRTRLDEAARIIEVEYDASRLTEGDIAALLRAAGVDIRAKRVIAL